MMRIARTNLSNVFIIYAESATNGNQFQSYLFPADLHILSVQKPDKKSRQKRNNDGMVTHKEI